MKTIAINSTEKTPEIMGNIKNGTLTIAGRSYMEDAQMFFNPLRTWLEDFYRTDSKSITVIIDLEFMNTSTGMVLVGMLKELSNLSKVKTVNVYWRYDVDDLDMLEVGKDFKFFIGDIIELQGKFRLAS